MNGLYPIIRRKRRPLLESDTPPTVIGNAEPVKAEAGRPKEAKGAKAAENVAMPGRLSDASLPAADGTDNEDY